MIDLTKHEWKGFETNKLPDPTIERSIIVVSPDADYFDICDIFTDNEGVKISKYNNTYHELQVLDVHSRQLQNLRWDYIKIK